MESAEQDRRYSFLLVIIGLGAILYGTLALVTEPSASPLLLFDPALGAALLAAGVLWGPFLRHPAPRAELVRLPSPMAVDTPKPSVSPPPGAQMEPPPIWLEDLEPPMADAGASIASPGSDGVLLELEKIRVDAGRRKGASATPVADEAG